MPNFEALKDHVDRLHALLAEPQYGLMTWNEFVGSRWKAIVELWEEDEKEAAAGQRLHLAPAAGRAPGVPVITFDMIPLDRGSHHLAIADCFRTRIMEQGYRFLGFLPSMWEPSVELWFYKVDE